MDTHMDSPTWTTSPPATPGLYHFACDETDDAWELVRVDTWLSLQRRMGAQWAGEHFGVRVGLYVDCPHLGVMPVRDYHDGLTAPRWRLVDPLVVEQMDAEDGAADQIRDFPGIGKNYMRDSPVCSGNDAAAEDAPFGWGTLIAAATDAYPKAEGEAWRP